MIDKHQLKLNNWVSHFGKEVQITEILDTHANISSFYAPYEYLNPIVLTPDVLNKLGFKYSNNKTYGNHFSINPKKGSKIVLYKNSWYEAAVKDSPFHVFHNAVEVKSLHQLQNLYHSLTQTELIYNAK